MQDILTHAYKFLNLKDYYSASVAFKHTCTYTESKKRFEWAKKKAKIPKYIDGYCADRLCGKRKAACIFIIGDTPKYIILSNYCSLHAEDDLI